MKLHGQNIAYWRNEIKSNCHDLYLISNANSLRYVLYVFALNIFSLFLIGFSINTSSWLLLPFVYLVVGYVYYQYQFLLHEASHAVLFSSRKANDLLGKCFGILTGYTFSSYRSNHMKHHKFLGTNLDPENGNFVNDDKSKTKLLLLKAFFFIDASNQFLSFFRKNETNSTKIKSTILYSFLLYIFVVLLFNFFNHWNFIQTAIFTLSLVLPIITLTFFLNRLRTIKEHPLGKVYEDTLFTVTHSRGFLWNYLCAAFNFNYHLEHHLMPEISSLHYPRVNSYLVSVIGSSKGLK